MTKLINCDVGVVLDDDHKGRHSAFAKVTGMIVYGNTEQEVLGEIHDAVRFFFRTVIERDGGEGLMDYLDRHEVVYEVVEQETKEPLHLRQSVLVNA